MKIIDFNNKLKNLLLRKSYYTVIKYLSDRLRIRRQWITYYLFLLKTGKYIDNTTFKYTNKYILQLNAECI